MRLERHQGQHVEADIGLALLRRLHCFGQHRTVVEAGLVHACVDDVLAHALAVADELAHKPQPALGHIKHLARRAAEGGLAAGLAAERTLFCDTMVSEAALQRMTELNGGQREISDRAALPGSGAA